MKSLPSLLVLLLIIVPGVVIYGQCPNFLSASTQQKLEDFINEYPLCTEMAGYISISGDVTDLTPLSNITSVGSWVSIRSDLLTSLNGLDQLTTVGGDLRIESCDVLTSLQGLGSLISVGEDFEILSNPVLTTLEGVGGLTTVGGQVYIFNNAGVTSIDGLTSLSSIGTSFRISTNDALVTIVGPENLTTIPDQLNIAGHSSTQQIVFENLVSVGGNLFSNSNNGTLEFPQLKEVGDIFFGGNTNISKLDLTSLETVSGSVFIGLSSLTIFIGGDALQTIGEELYFRTALTEAPLFASLTTIGGNFTATSWETMKKFVSMPVLTTVGGSIYFVQHALLEEIDAFNSLVSVGGEIEIRENDELIILNAFASLETVAEDFYVSFNPKLNECSSLCSYLENGTAGDFRIIFNGNAQGPCWSETILRDVCDSPYEGFKAIDANPKLLSELISSTDDVRNLDAAQLVDVNLERTAIAADGVTELVLISEYNEAGTVEFTHQGVPLEQPWGTETITFNGAHYGFAIYKAPEDFNASPESRSAKSQRYQGVESFSVAISISFEGVEESVVSTGDITVVRPPVILVHGTYSNPEKAWKTASDGGEAMFQVLTNAGFKVFAVDYTDSNGDSNSGASSFEANKMILWENPEGIRDALDFYRNEMSTAATQADVVGHSLGGILARVYASGHYHPQYIRAANFFEGDINRLVTLAGTHFGSHLGELQVFLEDASIFDIGPLEWIAAQGQAFITSWFTGTPTSPAVRDQLPPPSNTALTNIGRTDIPSHAITLSVEAGMLKDALHDPHEEYFDLYWYISLLLYHNEDLRDLYLDYKMTLVELGYKASTTLDGGDPQELFPRYDDLMLFRDMIKDGLRYSGQLFAVLDGTFELPADIEILHWTLSEVGMGDIADPMLAIYQAGANPTGVAAKYFTDVFMPDAEGAVQSYLSVYDENMEALRSLIFNNDANDGVVRVESQSGELEKECANCVTHFEGVLHGFAPRYAEVQNGLIAILKGGMASFHEEGFPPVDDAQLLYYPANVTSLFKIPVTGAAAICRSGMVPSHARAFARVADAQDAIIIARPVNPDGTALIEKGAATKVMDVKPKSSNWGPQRGYLPARQRYSKIWKVFEGAKRDEMIAKYDTRVAENLANGITLERHLQVETCNGSYLVFIDENKNSGMSDMNAEDEVVLIPIQNPDVVCHWGDEFSSDMIIRDCEAKTNDHLLTPFQVMAAPGIYEEDGVTERFLTADYDLLMIGFNEGIGQGNPAPPDVEFLPGVGQITPPQQQLVNQLNGAVAATGYDGGNVTHHGPENQFSGSPYVDYPLTVFAPDDIPNGFFSGSSDGKILSIDMGPPGFRDIHLKRFINRMREEGYDLYHNPEAPGWHWEWDEGVPGYKLEDSKDIVDYVEQLPEKDCNKSGTQTESICDKNKPTDISPDAPESWLFGRSPQPGLRIMLRNTIVRYSKLQIIIESDHDAMLTLYLQDAVGNVRGRRTIHAPAGESVVHWDVLHLRSGLYTVHSGAHPAIRFVRM